MIGWAVEAWLASALLIALVLLVRGPVRRSFGARVAYLLWALPFLRLLLPPLPAQWHASHTPLAPLAPLAGAGERVAVLVLPQIQHPNIVSAAPSPTSALPLMAWLVLVWAVGAFGFLVWHLVRHHGFCRALLLRAEAVQPLPGGVRLVRSPAATGPLAFGLWRRYVAVPHDFDARYDADERAVALAHELNHHLRGDLWANWAALFTLALHWPNPLAWAAFRAFRADQEMANDARLMAGRGPALRHAYARAIVKAAHGGAISAACHLHTIDDLKGRLRMLATTTSRLRASVGAVSIAALMLGTLGLTASGSRAAAQVRAGVRHATGIELASLTPPRILPQVAETPEAPEPPATDATVSRHTVTHRITTTDGQVVREHTADVKDGQIISDEVMANMPEIRSIACDTGRNGAGTAGQMVMTGEANGHKQITICTDRIAAVAAKGAQAGVDAAEIERTAYRSALDGLRASRAKLSADVRLSEDSRREALASIDESIGELQDDLAHAGDDD